MERRTRGFTLVELMVVLIILGLLAAVAVPQIIGKIARGKQTKARLDVQAISSAAEIFYGEQGKFPEKLDDLVKKPAYAKGDWPLGGYLKSLPKDPWGNDYKLVVNTSGDVPLEVVSYGANGVQGGEGEDADVSSAHLDDSERK